MKPLLKWAGGKSRLAPSIANALGGRCEGTYFEPFVGSASVFLHLKSEGLVHDAVLSDANSKLIALHISLRDAVDDVLGELDALPTEDWRERYYEVRRSYNEGPFDGPGHAARFVWLNRAGYNGLYRENRRGEFNVPCGSYASLKVPEESRFREVAKALEGVELSTASFESVMARARTGDQIYCDPPYVPLSETACFVGYHKTPFGIEEQRSLSLSAQMSAQKGARVVLSNHDLPVVRNELYPRSQGFRHVAKPRVARAISRGPRRRVSEVIAAIGPGQERAA